MEPLAREEARFGRGVRTPPAQVRPRSAPGVDTLRAFPELQAVRVFAVCLEPERARQAAQACACTAALPGQSACGTALASTAPPAQVMMTCLQAIKRLPQTVKASTRRPHGECITSPRRQGSRRWARPHPRRSRDRRASDGVSMREALRGGLQPAATSPGRVGRGPSTSPSSRYSGTTPQHAPACSPSPC